MPYTVRYINHGYSVPVGSFSEACKRAVASGFDSAVEQNGVVLASWSILGGWHYYQDDTRTTIETPTPTDAELLAEHDAR